MTDEERYDMTYLRIVPMPPSIRKLRKKWLDEGGWDRPYQGEADFKSFYPMWFYNDYVGTVEFATETYGQDFRTRQYTREELGYGYVNSDSKPTCAKSVLRREAEYRQMWRKEVPKYKDEKLPTIKISFKEARK